MSLGYVLRADPGKPWSVTWPGLTDENPFLAAGDGLKAECHRLTAVGGSGDLDEDRRMCPIRAWGRRGDQKVAVAQILDTFSQCGQRVPHAAMYRTPVRHWLWVRRPAARSLDEHPGE
ncbi:hypothetical protein GCM10023169_29960 [Georgenia halophila]|uniref:Uncharacterized protein n=1 Tax=Georgenia halophila TaxID=620889 RepID=A0ABP8LI36_9MICO